jgi:hypothetical protein
MVEKQITAVKDNKMNKIFIYISCPLDFAAGFRFKMSSFWDEPCLPKLWINLDIRRGSSMKAEVLHFFRNVGVTVVVFKVLILSNCPSLLLSRSAVTYTYFN